ncbi:hypothetical protein Sked_14910 [Sanguibacter keddieii DSM 10542]|uniref:DUF4287 domain-containing protein n=1 Tax=Sanguibacter keddieii (strain ATCC 51767 / DSM 10542 / NCFB 3025 / ST-74) TaxID=446469 RepID=D1BFR6_SANKS|nr:hypothetical protein [Sanguibacter keddieii]ACZ21427.1 hypothetical protein Sked_14910 [Sanguibacter keddieii DSM 10542]
MTPAAALDNPTLDRIVPLVEQVRAARLAGDGAGEDPADGPGASAPEMSDEKIRAGTGRGWDEWVTLAAAGPGRDASHAQIATWAIDDHGLTGWWGHGVAVGVRRLTGQRVPGQMADGTFAVSRTKTLPITEPELREIVLDAASWALLLPGLEVTLRSKPTSKSLRFAIVDDGEPEGSILVTLAAAGADRCRATVSHEKLASTAAGERWKTFWAGWLDVVADALDRA